MSVSVIIPNFNNAPYVAQCLASVVTDPAVAAVLVYDNASTDESIGVIERHGGPKTRVIRGTHNIGAARARHALIAEVTTEYVSFLDSDDYLAPDTISAGSAAACASRLDLAVPEMRKLTAHGSELFVPRLNTTIDGPDAFGLTLGRWAVHPMGVLATEAYRRAANGFTFHGLSDDELLTRIILIACRRVGGCDGAYYYRWQPKDDTAATLLSRVASEIGVIRLAAGSNVSTHRRYAAKRWASVVITLAKLRLRGGDAHAIAMLARELSMLDIPPSRFHPLALVMKNLGRAIK
jgi:glycosyltransferase involved in cell wall biosynthesis